MVLNEEPFIEANLTKRQKTLVFVSRTAKL